MIHLPAPALKVPDGVSVDVEGSGSGALVYARYSDTRVVEGTGCTATAHPTAHRWSNGAWGDGIPTPSPMRLDDVAFGPDSAPIALTARGGTAFIARLDW